MSLIKLQGNASGTGAFTIAAPNSNTDRTLTLPDNTGTVLTTASTVTQKAMPAFRAYTTSSQTITSGTFTKVALQAKSFDSTSAFDSTTNYRFQPTVAGYYQTNGSIYFQATSSLSRLPSTAPSGPSPWHLVTVTMTRSCVRSKLARS